MIINGDFKNDTRIPCCKYAEGSFPCVYVWVLLSLGTSCLSFFFSPRQSLLVGQFTACFINCHGIFCCIGILPRDSFLLLCGNSGGKEIIMFLNCFVSWATGQLLYSFSL
ncbi:uncharacterized protein EURHEDRAFT_38508 [Aspergillus ruber CBS 135680]|uniref:Uncharacterized protein n=1 Tax=Aspergillus ruber (strain CBS 135680) TaxID=1388766 RepID=A0A017SGI4_ASPRC|nr:uncharacterized protein EURHEDRAFT_38508 [Aspergillus ruber CBS 135680]EYE95876.1 hypothetical protein EURHEDRAFT_38508 [Aspergillus ruber CBS 135680]